MALDNVDQKEELLIEPGAGLLANNRTNSRFSHRKSSMLSLGDFRDSPV